MDTDIGQGHEHDTLRMHAGYALVHVITDYYSTFW